MVNPTASAPGPDLAADCSRCFGLCCVALAFARSADFAVDKAAGDPCHNLDDADRCTIHARLRPEGFKGCTVFDCFGAGQKVSQGTFGGRSWRHDDGSRALMFEVFPVVRRLQEVLWYLVAAMTMRGTEPVRDDLEAAVTETQRLTGLGPQDLAALDVDAHRDGVNVLLAQASGLARATYPSAPRTKRTRRIGPGADLLGARLDGADLRGADLRGTYLIAADLQGADLRGADVIGADLRDADVRGADLSEALFLTQVQVSSAVGDAATRLPGTVRRPDHWA
ncbi:pentapeptide repeat-containing protein [Sanguibacter sp. YZGR15]|uniref:Pentapeptide repeat-containing protein n=1 Tax=Sanguibacter suaedae TaxID=2795737 RepID=A0A934M5X6_9MICO|nr:pentapeptide repeat-containing protein [Sanguibacter suaedae]